jgi:hypothetical protein
MKSAFDVARKYLEQAESKPEPEAIPELPLRAWVIKEIWDGDRRLAVMICSAVIEAHFWLVLDRSFTPDDSLGVYYPEELEWLRDKDPQTLKKVHETKLAFPGARVTQ